LALQPGDLLTDEVRARIARLDVTAQTLVEGPVTGLHKSPFQGFSVEFAQHREYTWGDDLKHLDWKVFARTDRYVIKEYEEETNLQAMVLLDSSESMVYAGERARASKYEYGATLAAGLAFLFLRQQDGLGLTLFDDEMREYIPPSAHPAQLRRLAKTMAEVKVRGESNPQTPTVFHRMAEKLRRRGMVFIVSDLLFPTPEFLEGLRHLRHRRHEVVVFHTLDPDELDFPFDDATRFEGLETTSHLLADPRSLRDSYLAQMNAFRGAVETGCRNARADYIRVDTRLPPGTTLARYLTYRQRRRRLARG
jgi:uncharacterized protein (DUF58 family)